MRRFNGYSKPARPRSRRLGHLNCALVSHVVSFKHAGQDLLVSVILSVAEATLACKETFFAWTNVSVLMQWIHLDSLEINALILNNHEQCRLHLFCITVRFSLYIGFCCPPLPISSP